MLTGRASETVNHSGEPLVYLRGMLRHTHRAAQQRGAVPTLAEVASRTARRSGRLLIALAAIPAIAGAALLLARALEPSTATPASRSPTTRRRRRSTRARSARSPTTTRRAALVQGGDGGQSSSSAAARGGSSATRSSSPSPASRSTQNSIAWSDTRDRTAARSCTTTRRTASPCRSCRRMAR